MSKKETDGRTDSNLVVVVINVIIGSKYREVAEEELRALLTLRSSPSRTKVFDRTLYVLHRPFRHHYFSVKTSWLAGSHPDS